jgi:hypothetical protein
MRKMTPRDPKQFPGDEYTVASDTNTNICTYIWQKTKSFLGMSNGTKKLFNEKMKIEKSHDIVPLN